MDVEFALRLGGLILGVLALSVIAGYGLARLLVWLMGAGDD